MKTKKRSELFASYPDVVTIQELQQMLRISRHSAYGLIHNGEIPARRFGRVYRITKAAVIDYISQVS